MGISVAIISVSNVFASSNLGTKACAVHRSQLRRRLPSAAYELRKLSSGSMSPSPSPPTSESWPSTVAPFQVEDMKRQRDATVQVTSMSAHYPGQYGSVTKPCCPKGDTMRIGVTLIGGRTVAFRPEDIEVVSDADYDRAVEALNVYVAPARGYHLSDVRTFAV